MSWRKVFAERIPRSQNILFALRFFPIIEATFRLFGSFAGSAVFRGQHCAAGGWRLCAQESSRQQPYQVTCDGPLPSFKRPYRDESNHQRVFSRSVSEEVPHQNDPALEESAEELYEIAPCGYLTATIDTRIVKVNRTLTEWLGYDASELTGGKRFVDLLTAGGRMFYETHFNLLLRMQSSVNEIALDMICKDGRVLPVLIYAKQKRTTDDKPVLNRFTIFNATERRMYERELLAARDLLQTTLTSIGDGVVSTDAEGRIIFMNPVAWAICGWKEEAAIGKPIDEVMVLIREDTTNRLRTR